MESNSSQPPIFETDPDRTYFPVILPVPEKFLQTQTTQPHTKVKTRKSIEEIKVMILDTLKQSGHLSSTELATTMGYTKVTAAVSKAIKELMADGKVVYSDLENIRSRNQKICLVKNYDEQ